jgi:hypothetical protein
MTIQQGQCTVFKQNCLSGLENFAAGTSYTYKIALYTASANLSYATTAYTSTNEVTGTGYTAGGISLVISQVPTSSDQTAYISFNNATWTGVSFTCRGALIYNSTTKAAVAVLDFGGDKTAGPNFTVTFPTAGSTTAIIRYS